MKPTSDSHISVLAMNDKGPAPEAAIGRDLIKHGLIVAPVMLGVCAIFWGADGAWSSAYGLAIVLGNFALAAFLVSYTARISYALMMGATLFGYIVRLGIISAAVYFVRNASWVELIPPVHDYCHCARRFAVLGIALCFFVARISRTQAKTEQSRPPHNFFNQ